MTTTTLNRKQRRAASKRVGKYGREFDTVNGVTFYKPTSIKNHADICGAVPARNEMFESYGVANQDRQLAYLLETDVETPSIDSWTDVVAVTPKGILELRVPTQKTVEVYRPAYHDTLTLTNFEFAVAYHMMAYSFWSNYLHHKGPSIQMGFWILTQEEAFKEFAKAEFVAVKCDMGKVFRYLD